jgi:NAD-dependent deacetylase
LNLKSVKELIKKSNKITILTGAGISTESGISDYRSPGGIWSQYKTVYIQELISDIQQRRNYWHYKAETIPDMIRAKSNEAHKAIGRLDRQGKLHYLLTQNIDGLHEKGGVSPDRVINLHGTNLEAICWTCKKIYDIEIVLARLNECDYDPRCEENCDGFLKPNTVSFGQNLNPDHLRISGQAIINCDLFMALGSSLVVQPVCSFVQVAADHNKPIIIINREQTPYDNLAEFKLTNSLAEILPEII